MLCMPGLGRPDGDYPRVGRHISRRTYARSLSPSDLRRTLPDLRLMQSGLSQAAISAPAWRSSLDGEARAGSQHRREELSLQTGAGEGVAKTKNSLVCATQDEARSRKIDRGKTDAGAVEPRSDQRLADENGAASISHERIYQHVWKTRKTAEPFMSSCVTAVKSNNKRKGKTSGRGLIRTAWTSTSAPPLSPRKAASATGSRHDYRGGSQRHHHVARRPQVQIHQAHQAP